ncbi:unnamed protein product [Caenorhabditis angaria]|uniref:Uncharacterized protein n=1 Tax=Caenorhabditis angaria TaxID=860376 RepID=A0A9P1IKE2_9PELO|nr:unnamed protein product [Caenorhabditis angaria]
MELSEELRNASKFDESSEDEEMEQEFLKNARFFNDYVASRFGLNTCEQQETPQQFQRICFEEKRKMFDIEFPQRVSAEKMRKGREALKIIAANREKYFKSAESTEQSAEVIIKKPSPRKMEIRQRIVVG